MKIFPKCHPYWIIDDERVKNPKIQNPAYTAEGYLLPCCWCDKSQLHVKAVFESFGLYDPDLKVSNVDDIEQDILKSPEWYRFHETLLQDPESAPDVCKRKCTDKDDYVKITRKH